jgi:hypothetical protein
MKLKFRIQRLIRYEFWPFWIFYAPFVPLWLWHSVRLRSFTWFTLANPKMYLGGFMNYSKSEILEPVNEKYKPKTCFFSQRPENLEFYTPDFQFPFVCKPESGERGRAVMVIENQQQWEECFASLDEPFLLQEYVDWQQELGVFYYRFPSGKSGISSVTTKQFLTIEGNGKQTVCELVEDHLRAAPRRNYFQQKWSNIWNTVLEKNTELLLEPVGNHCKGTTFLNGNHLINSDMVKLFDQIAAPMDGFYYGRFDIKVKQLDDLYSGENLKIFEVNGANSEATHIYDPALSLSKAYSDVANQLNLMAAICNENKKRGAQPTPVLTFLKELFSRV